MAKHKPNDPCWCGSAKKYKRCHRDQDQTTSSLLKTAGVGAAVKTAAASKKTRRVRPGRIVRPGSLSPRRSVPDGIARPDYADSGRPSMLRPRKLVKSPELIEKMRRAGRAAREVLEAVTKAAAPGVTTDELDAICHEECIKRGGYPSPLNYHGFPKSLCTSVNEVICHGIPDSTRLLEGDIVNCDVTIFLDGVHGDCSETVLVGEVDEASRALVEHTREALMRGIGAVAVGGRVRDIGRAIQDYIKPLGYGIVRSFVGHGIGEVFHMDPQVPHYYDRSAKTSFKAGMTFTIEPMVNIGVADHDMWADRWTAVTCDLQRSAQFEHTILVRDDGVEILTLAAGLEQPFLKQG